MNDRIPRGQRDHVLVDVKAKPSGWPTASLDPDSGRGPQATSGTPARTREPAISGLYGFRGLPDTLQDRRPEIEPSGQLTEFRRSSGQMT
jgi:hypothetical protein